MATPDPLVSDLVTAYDLQSFAAILGLTAKQLTYLLYKKNIPDKYRSFEIKKKSGAVRQIRSPNDQLKYLQRNLLKHLVLLREFRPYVTAFVKGRGLIDNSTLHVNKKHVLNIDLEDFFGSVNYGRIFGMLCKPPYGLERSIAAAISRACIYENSLPQGAPTSPILANLICGKLDAQLHKLCRDNKCTYSRYADDITISTQLRKFPLGHVESQDGSVSPVVLLPRLREIIETNGFKINESKSRLYTRTARQEVTGLIVNERLNVKRTYIRNIRAILNSYEKYGAAAVQKTFEEKFGGTGPLDVRVAGRIGFVGQIRGRNDPIYRTLVKRFNELKLGMELRSEPTKRELAEQAVWVIESTSSDGKNCSQGSAFILHQYGMVTCAHCIYDKTIIYHRDNKNKHINVKLKKIDNHRDLAIFELPPELENIPAMKLAKQQPDSDQLRAWLFGYPNHVLWRPIRIEQGEVVRYFPWGGVRHLEITPKIIEGNSGGPITNNEFEVIGIARKGINSSSPVTSAEYIGVSAEEIKNLA